MGYEGVDLAPRDAWGLIRDAGMTIASIGGHKSLADGLNRSENHDRIEREIKESLEAAVEWHIPSVLCFSGNRHGDSDERGIEVTADGLSRVAKAAEDAGVTLVMELLNSKVNHKGYQCDRTAWGVEVCSRVGSPRVKLLYDIYHMQIQEGDIIRTIRENHEHIGHYHTAGNPGRHDLDTEQEIYYPAVCRAIAETGFDGFIGQEFSPKGDPLEALRQAIGQCGGLAG